MTAENSIENLRLKIESIRFCMVTTIGKGPNGLNLSSHPMTQQALDDDGTLWLFTADDYQLAHDINHHPAINAVFTEPDDSLYVSISGTAELVKDRGQFRKLWSPMAAAWYPRGIDDPHLSLIKMTIHTAEHWDSYSNKMMQLYTAITTTQPKDNVGYMRMHLN